MGGWSHGYTSRRALGASGLEKGLPGLGRAASHPLGSAEGQSFQVSEGGRLRASHSPHARRHQQGEPPVWAGRTPALPASPGMFRPQSPAAPPSLGGDGTTGAPCVSLLCGPPCLLPAGTGLGLPREPAQGGAEERHPAPPRGTPPPSRASYCMSWAGGSGLQDRLDKAPVGAPNQPWGHQGPVQPGSPGPWLGQSKAAEGTWF